LDITDTRCLKALNLLHARMESTATSTPWCQACFTMRVL
jgi:hypothetical protein